jgi:hypothetical protein
MTKVVMQEKTNGVKFRSLEVGDCFLDKDNLFCIKVDSTTCLYTGIELNVWEVRKDCEPQEEVFPMDIEIHIAN